MNSTLKAILLLLIPVLANAQTSVADSLRAELKNAPNDPARYQVYRQLLLYYDQANMDSALYFSEKCLLIAQSHNNKISESEALAFKGWYLLRLGRYASSLQSLILAFEIAQDPKNENHTWELGDKSKLRKSRLTALALTHNMFAHLMGATDDTSQQIIHFKKAKEIGEEICDSNFVGIVDLNIAGVYINSNKLDSALTFIKNSEHNFIQTGHKIFLSYIFAIEGDIYIKKGYKKSAKQFYYEGIQSGREQNNLAGLLNNYFPLTKYYLSEKNKDSSLYYAKKSLKSLHDMGGFSHPVYNIGTVYENLYHSYQLCNQFDSAFKYQGLALVAKDSLYKKRIKNLADFQNASLKEQLRLQNMEKENVVYQNKVRTYGLIAALGIFLLILLILYFNNKQKQKANLVLQKALAHLKSTQSQLIQSEKMASLGELTAGIAHEIQNPLNFVNNFSEINAELIEDAEQALDKGNMDEAKSVLADVKENERKINYHGRRADSIVKGMLQHSRKNTGKKEPTDINALADEYLRLSYHGLRAKDKNFNATIETDFDESIHKVEVVPQDMGRVLLNLYNNAFYAVNEKKKELGETYEPIISVTTKTENDKVEIRVKDNGNGIPQKVVDKIFQPFFTTKPPGEGTGLGLSLSYDIIIKGHNGTIKIDSKEGEYTIFTIELPLE